MGTSKSTRYLSDKKIQPPEKLIVKTHRANYPTTDNRTEYLGKLSVKRRIHENWRKRFPITTIKLKKQNKMFKVVNDSSVKNKLKLKRRFNDSDEDHIRKRRK